MRGAGLLLGAVLSGEYAGPACQEALRAGLVLNAPRPDVLRFAPSLLVSDGEIDQALAILGPVLAAGAAAHGAAPPPAPDDRDVPSEAGTR